MERDVLIRGERIEKIAADISAADLVIVKPDTPYTVTRESLLAKCGWSPFEGHTFTSTVDKTFVSAAQKQFTFEVISLTYRQYVTELH